MSVPRSPALKALVPEKADHTFPRALPAVLALALCLIALAAAAWVATAVFDRVPHVEDELAFLFQARAIAEGQLLARAPALPEFFRAPFIVLRDGQWFGKYPPGYPVVLALGVLVDRPWLVNPFCGAVAVALAYFAGRRLYGVRTALLAAALLVASPFFLLQAGSFLSHVASLVWALAFLVLFEAARRRSSTVAALAAGAALGMLFLTRPLTAVGVALPFVLWAAIDVARERRRVLVYLPLAAGFLPFLAALLAYNYLTTGDVLRSAYELYWPYDRVGFGEGIGSEGRHTLSDALLNTKLNLSGLADYLFGWPWRLSLLPAALASALAIAQVAGLAGRTLAGTPRRVRAKYAEMAGGAGTPSPLAWDLLQIGVVAGLVGVHAAYWTTGEMYGPRYYFEALGALALLSARGIWQVADFVAALIARFARPGRPVRTAASAATLLLVAGLVVQGIGTFGLREFGRFTRWYNVDASGLRAVRAAGVQNAVVFVAGGQWTAYAPFFSQNVPSLDSSVVYAVDLGPERDRDLTALYPGRSAFRYADGRLTPLAR